MLLAPATKPAPKRTPVLAITATGVPTLSGAVLQGDKWIFEKREDGDGLVTVASALPPEAFTSTLNVTHISLAMPHRGMFTQRSLQDKVTPFLVEHGF
jgi:hypothetical protein